MNQGICLELETVPFRLQGIVINLFAIPLALVSPSFYLIDMYLHFNFIDIYIYEVYALLSALDVNLGKNQFKDVIILVFRRETFC